MISSYVPKKNKAVLMLSTKHYDKETEDTPPHKPKTILDYNRTKSGVDTMDQLVKNYSCKRISNRWPMAIFYWMLDVAAHNASVLFMDREPEIYSGSRKRRQYLMDLSESLVMPQIERRSSSEGFQLLHKDTKLKIEAFIPRQILPTTDEVKGSKKRCGKCPRNMDKKTRKACVKCASPICDNHANFICNDCI